MKIGRINRLAKAGEMVSVRLPDGKTISAKAGNDLNSTTVVISKTQSGWFAFSSQGEIKAVSTQVINRRPRQVTPEIYPIKVLFSVEFDDRFEFYIGGDRNIPIKIWELEKVSIPNQGTTRIKSAAINSTGNKPDDWIVMIQYLSPDLIFTTPSGQAVDTLINLEASAILQPSSNPIIHVGANGSDPVGNGFFAPRDPYIWYFFDETVNADSDEDFLATGEDYRPYKYSNSLKGIELSRSGSSDDLAISLRFVVWRPWLNTEAFQGLITTSLSELWLYEYVPSNFALGFPTETRIGTSSDFAYLNAIYDAPGIDFNVERSVFISNLYAPSTGTDSSLFLLDWNEIETLSQSEIVVLLDVFCPNFHNSIMTGGLTIEETNLVKGNYMADTPYDKTKNQAFDVNLLRALNIVQPGGGAGYVNDDNNFYQAKTTAFRSSRDIYDYKRTYTESRARLASYAFFATASTQYSFNPRSTISSGTFHYVIVSPLGIERTSIPYDLASIHYRRQYDSRAILEQNNLSLVTKGSAFGNMQMMGVTFDVDVKKTIFSSFADRYWVYSGHGEAIKQRGLDNSAIIHKINYEWYANSSGSSTETVSFTIPPSFLEESFYYKNGFKYSLTTTNSDFRAVTSVYLDMFQRQEINVGSIINYSGFRIVPKFNAEDILENNKISRVAWSEQDGNDLKERNIKLNVKTYRIIVDEGTATIPNSSKIKTFKVKNLSPILSQLDPVVADTAIVYSMSCYFN